MDKTGLTPRLTASGAGLTTRLTALNSTRRTSTGEKPRVLTLPTRAKTEVVSELVLAATVRQQKLRDSDACRRCGAPSVQTFRLLFERVMAPARGPWSRAKLWDTMFTQYTCRRCGQVYALPRAEPTTPKNTPTYATPHPPLVSHLCCPRSCCCNHVVVVVRCLQSDSRVMSTAGF